MELVICFLSCQDSIHHTHAIRFETRNELQCIGEKVWYEMFECEIVVLVLDLSGLQSVILIISIDLGRLSLGIGADHDCFLRA